VPCDVGVFGSLKIAYREEVERLYRGGSSMIGKQHFTLLYGVKLLALEILYLVGPKLDCDHLIQIAC
jgi:hypothetical protein